MGKRKTPGDEDSENLNSDICDFLLELGEYEKNVSRNIYKYNAYRQAARVLASHPTRVKSGSEAKKLNGIGEKISKKIDEFLETGKLEKLETIRQDPTNKAIALLTRVSGIGPAKAKSLVSEGITTLEDLRKHQDKLNHHQKIGLKYFEDFEKKIPRSEIEEIEKVIREQLRLLDAQIEVTICGSYRRGKAESGDIDCLITHPSYKAGPTSGDEASNKKKVPKSDLLKSVVETLEASGLITETLSLGDAKFMGACKLNPTSTTRRLDIRLTPYDQYYCAVLYFTGSDLFNKEMRKHALDAGFTLNEYSLRPLGSTKVPGEPVEIHSERDIFDYIDFPYKEPQERSQ